MPKKNFLLLSLEDKEAKNVANIVGSSRSKKILEYLSDQDGTETEIARSLNLPLSTVHYNLQQLKRAKLVDTQEFHYSKKGKEVLHYTLANKYIIIAPKKETGLHKRLSSIFSVLLVGVGVSGLLHWWQQKSLLSTIIPQAEIAAAPMAARMMDETVQESADAMMVKAQPLAEPVSATLPILDSFGFWFFCGVILATLLYYFLSIRKRE